ncbi:uncharacterized protein LTR77_007685 [Saxophila tyrrhenica]|uniref:Uncharacterized protein n=1 Tax=Saxophila tyrrhenica TaxID=1690608 RepID=A0AAV9P3J7_9PEZI|nr:hypothetical protein LTR77_007685 [Saxophila tyrrhenica]
MEASEAQKKSLHEAMAELYEDFEGDAFFTVPEGNGSTFSFGTKFDGADDATHHIEGSTKIGTFFCITCVRLYIQIDSRGCFTAHINAWSLCEHIFNFVDAADGEVIRKEVQGRLHYEYKTRNWDCGDDNFAKLVVVCSPRPQVFVEGEKVLEESIKLGGWNVFLGVRDFPSSRRDNSHVTLLVLHMNVASYVLNRTGMYIFATLLASRSAKVHSSSSSYT